LVLSPCPLRASRGKECGSKQDEGKARAIRASKTDWGRYGLNIYHSFGFLIACICVMNVLSFSSGKNLKEGLVTLEEDLVKLTDELQMEAQCIPNMLIHMLRLEWKIVQQWERWYVILSTASLYFTSKMKRRTKHKDMNCFLQLKDRAVEFSYKFANFLYLWCCMR